MEQHGNKKVNTNIPVIFQNLEKYEQGDIRFQKVAIWLMHTGINFNMSSFSKEAVEKAIPTLANTPILAFIEDNSNGEQDFSDHRMVLHRNKDGELNIKYLGQAVGVIPETNNARFEKRVTDSGEEKEYLVVEGLMWTKFDDPIDIINRKGVTAQSMELADDYTGYFDDNGIFNFETFKFFGACLLGDDVSPAMENSTVELQFSNNSYVQNTIENKLNEFYTLFSQQEGGNTVMEQETQVETETVEQTEFTEEVVENTEAVNEEVETTENNDDVVEETEVTETTTEEVETETSTETEQVEEAQTEFALTSEQLKHQLRSVLSNEKYIDRWGDSCRRYWYVDYTTEVVIYEDSQNNDQLFSAEYTLNGDNVVVNFASAKKVKIEYVPFETAEVFTINTDKFESIKSTLTTELEALKEYKRTREEQDLRSQFDGQLTEDELNVVFEENQDSTLEEIETKVYALIGKKNFSRTETKPANKIGLDLNKEVKTDADEPYNGLFSKHLNNK